MTKNKLAALVLFFLGDTLLALGFIAFMLAPEGAKASTALIVSGASAALLWIFAGLCVVPGKTAQMIGIHGGLVLPLLLGGAFAFRGVSARSGVQAYEEQRAAFLETVNAGDAQDTHEAYEAWIEETGADPKLDHDKTYLMAILFTMAAVSFVTTAVLVAMRPKPAERGTVDNAADGAASPDQG